MQFEVVTAYQDPPAPANAACSACPVPSLVVTASPDNGVTWNTPTFMCKCKNMGWQYDPQLEVASDGTVYGLILSKWHEYLVKSTDHGATFSKPIVVSQSLPNAQGSTIAVAPDDTATVVRQLKSQVAELQAAIKELRDEARQYRAETLQLRGELQSAIAHMGPSVRAPESETPPPPPSAAGASSGDDRLSKTLGF